MQLPTASLTATVIRSSVIPCIRLKWRNCLVSEYHNVDGGYGVSAICNHDFWAGLIVVGTILVVFQMILQVKYPEARFSPRSVNIVGPFKTKAALKTTYSGLVMILIGGLMEIVGYLATAPWK